MTKDEFVTERTRIISEMLDNPDKHGIYPTTKCFDELDALFDKLTSDNSDYAKCEHDFEPRKTWVHTCKKCGTVQIEKGHFAEREGDM